VSFAATDVEDGINYGYVIMEKKRRQKEEEADHIEDTQRLVTEIEMLKVVLFFVCRNRRKEQEEKEEGFLLTGFSYQL
jgi:hypothetical protein